jgi:hypothetical protein
MTASVHLEKKNPGHESQWTCHQDELIGGRPVVVKSESLEIAVEDDWEEIAREELACDLKTFCGL